jgi:hypothetical protein
MKNEVVMHQLVPFDKQDEKLRSGMMMDYLISQTKHPIN